MSSSEVLVCHVAWREVRNRRDLGMCWEIPNWVWSGPIAWFCFNFILTMLIQLITLLCLLFRQKGIGFIVTEIGNMFLWNQLTFFYWIFKLFHSLFLLNVRFLVFLIFFIYLILENFRALTYNFMLFFFIKFLSSLFDLTIWCWGLITFWFFAFLFYLTATFFWFWL